MNKALAHLAFIVLALTALATHANAQQDSQRLTLKGAIDLALKNNLSVRVASTQVDEAEGKRQRNLAVLLPHASGHSLANLQTRNLQVAGISFPGIPTVVGPYSYYDFRVAASQVVIDRQGYHNWKSASEEEQAERLSYQDTRDLVIREAAGFYLDAEYAAAKVQAAQSRVTTSQTLEKLARDQHDQSLATGLDVIRAQVQLSRDRQTLLVAQDTYQTALLQLARFLGLRPGTPIDLADQLQFRRLAPPSIEQAIQTALQARSDYRSLLIRRESLVEQLKASRARYLPKLAITADYGAIGRNFGSLTRTGEMQATLSINLFDRDRNGEQKQLESRIQRINVQVEDMTRGIEQDIRKVELDLDSTEQQVAVTEAALGLARRELQLAEDRFHNGVSDNIEVVSAQDALTRAEDDRIGAIARHTDARMALARALGATEDIYKTYLGAP